MTSFTLLEPLEDGHCTFWAQILLTAAANDRRISHLRLVTGATMAERLAPLTGPQGIEVDILGASDLEAMRAGGLLARGRAQWARAHHELAVTGGGRVFLPFMDHAVVAAALDRRKGAGGGTISGIIFRPPNGHGLPGGFRSRLDGLRRWSSYALARRGAIGRLFTLDELAPESRAGRFTRALDFLPDPAPDLEVLAVGGASAPKNGRRVALLFGALTERKGIFPLIAAWGGMPAAFHAGHALRLVGRLGQAERATTLQALDRLRQEAPAAVVELEDRFVSDTELAQEVRSAALILAPYQNHVGSSGVLYWAAAATRPLLGQNTGLIGWQIARHGLGVATDCTDPSAIRRALPEAFSFHPQGAANADFVAAHSPEAFARTILTPLLAS